MGIGNVVYWLICYLSILRYLYIGILVYFGILVYCCNTNLLIAKFVWYCKALYGIAWYCIIVYGISWYCIEVYGISWHFIVKHCIAWYRIVLHCIALFASLCAPSLILILSMLSFGGFLAECLPCL